jgi:glucose-6-phosphate isomerase
VTTHGAAADAVGRHVPTLVSDRVASRLAGRDADLWGAAAQEEASKRLGWFDLAQSSRPLPERITALREELAAEGVDRVVLCGMGGSSLAPEVITGTAGVPLVVLDGTDPGQVARALTELERTVVVVSSKSGSTVETDSQRRAFEVAFAAAGIDAASRIVVVTDPGSPLQEASKAAGYRAIFEADPEVGGRYSALTAFGLVPSGLAGVDVGGLLDEAADVMAELSADDESNPALALAAAMAGTQPRRDKLVIVDEGSGLAGFGDWAEQLIAESTGKEGTGVLPVVVEGAEAPEVRSPAPDVVVARLLPAETGAAAGSGDDGNAEVTVSGTLGAQMLLWETATAIAGRLLGINPFDQPDVESAKIATRGLLDAQPAPEPPAFVDDGIEVRATDGLLGGGSGTDGAQSVDAAVTALLGQLDPATGYVAVMAYLDREASAELADVRAALARRSGRPVTFGWGPRFLHSTGQFHKGGPASGVYLQVTAETGQDLAIPERPFTFGTLIAAQAAGDAQVLADHDRPVLRLHLTRGAADVPSLVAKLEGGA